MASFAARIDQRFAERWTERAETYSVIQLELRDVGGLLGNGGLAVTEGSNAVARLRAIPTETIVDARSCPFPAPAQQTRSPHRRKPSDAVFPTRNGT
jgi:hypothetical protein